MQVSKCLKQCLFAELHQACLSFVGVLTAELETNSTRVMQKNFSYVCINQNLSLCSPYYAETCNDEFAVPIPAL